MVTTLAGNRIAERKLRDRLSVGLSNAYFKSLGLPSLAEE
jgi:hypothetical protein